jgi:2',3'-cyclic-nucleotide 2'-phosphodiesterase / 3'-nucleotidase / 5'-nucleotidase
LVGQSDSIAFCMRSSLLVLLAVLAAGRGAAQPATDLVIAATTDVHGRLRGWDYYAGAEDRNRGLSRAATVIDSVRRANPGRVVLVDAGDLLQGNPLTYLAARVAPLAVHPVIAAMNAAEYDAAVIGNHEFNYGLGLLDRALTQSRVPFLAANVYDAADRRRRFRGYTIVERSGIKVGLVGLTTPGAMIWDRDSLANRITIRDIVPEAQRVVDEVRKAGADVVVAIMHSGLGEPTSYDASRGLGQENVAARVAMETRGLDLIVYGHSHREMADTVIGRTTLIQPRNFAANVAVATLRVERDERGRWNVTNKRGRLLSAAGQPEQAAVVAATREAHEATLRYVATPIGTTSVTWRSDSARVVDAPLTDFVLDVMRRKAGADLAAGAAFDLTARLDSGPITQAQLARLYPYDNTLRAVRISGAQLRAFLEQCARYFGRVDESGALLAGESATDPQIPGFNFDIVAGAEYTIDLRRPVGSRITTLAVRGTPVRDGDSFTMALSNYRATGGGGFAMLEGAPVTFTADGEVRQFLEEEVRRVGTLRPDAYASRNWRIEPSGAVATMYRAMQPSPPRAQPTGSGRTLRLVGINDFHGQLEPFSGETGPSRGGGVALAAAVARAMHECRPGCTSLLVDGGDRFTGTLSSSLTHGRSVVAMMNAMGLTASALGNHEFDWSVDTMRARIRETHGAVLAANVLGPDGTRPSWLRADTLVERDGLRIGIIGIAATHTSRSTHWRYVKGYQFLDPAPVIDRHAKSLRARGATHVVVIAHEAVGCDRDTPTRCTGPAIDFTSALTERVDAVLAGHSHRAADGRVGSVPVVQAWSSGRAIAVVDLPLDGGTPRSEIRTVWADSTRGAPAAVDSIVRAAQQSASARATRVVGRLTADAPRDGREYTVGRLVVDAHRAVARADVAVTNSGGVRAGLFAGPVTYGQLYAVQPFGNPLVRLRVRGRELQAILERLLTARGIDGFVSGVRVTWDSTAAEGARVRSVRLNSGAAIRPTAVYTVVANDFMLGGDIPESIQRAAISIEALPMSDLSALERYFTMQKRPLAPPSGARFVEIHASATSGGTR